MADFKEALGDSLSYQVQKGIAEAFPKCPDWRSERYMTYHEKMCSLIGQNFIYLLNTELIVSEILVYGYVKNEYLRREVIEKLIKSLQDSLTEGDEGECQKAGTSINKSVS